MIAVGCQLTLRHCVSLCQTVHGGTVHRTALDACRHGHSLGQYHVRTPRTADERRISPRRPLGDRDDSTRLN